MAAAAVVLEGGVALTLTPKEIDKFRRVIYRETVETLQRTGVVLRAEFWQQSKRRPTARNEFFETGPGQ